MIGDVKSRPSSVLIEIGGISIVPSILGVNERFHLMLEEIFPLMMLVLLDCLSESIKKCFFKVEKDGEVLAEVSLRVRFSEKLSFKYTSRLTTLAVNSAPKMTTEKVKLRKNKTFFTMDQLPV
jgi:hypothetical protein